MANNIIQTLSGAYEFLDKTGLEALVNNIAKVYSANPQYCYYELVNQNITTSYKQIRINTESSNNTTTDSNLFEVVDNNGEPDVKIRIKKTGMAIAFASIFIRNRDGSITEIESNMDIMDENLKFIPYNSDSPFRDNSLWGNIKHALPFECKKVGYHVGLNIVNWTKANGMIEGGRSFIAVIFFENKSK